MRMLFSGGYFTAFEGDFLALRFHITTGGAAGGKSSICMWIAKRSLPIWAMIVEVPGSSTGLGNGNRLFLRFFMTTVMPPVRRNSKSPHECLPNAIQIACIQPDHFPKGMSEQCLATTRRRSETC